MPALEWLKVISVSAACLAGELLVLFIDRFSGGSIAAFLCVLIAVFGICFMTVGGFEPLVLAVGVGCSVGMAIYGPWSVLLFLPLGIGTMLLCDRLEKRSKLTTTEDEFSPGGY